MNLITMKLLMMELKKVHLIQQNFATGGQLISKWNNAFSTDISGYYTRYLLDATTFNPGNTQELKQRNEVTENAFKVDASYRFSSQLKLWGGYHFTGNRNSKFRFCKCSLL